MLLSKDGSQLSKRIGTWLVHFLSMRSTC